MAGAGLMLAGPYKFSPFQLMKKTSNPKGMLLKMLQEN
jgi:hypothetical protein